MPSGKFAQYIEEAKLAAEEAQILEAVARRSRGEPFVDPLKPGAAVSRTR